MHHSEWNSHLRLNFSEWEEGETEKRDFLFSPRASWSSITSLIPSHNHHHLLPLMIVISSSPVQDGFFLLFIFLHVLDTHTRLVLMNGCKGCREVKRGGAERRRLHRVMDAVNGTSFRGQRLGQERESLVASGWGGGERLRQNMHKLKAHFEWMFTGLKIQTSHFVFFESGPNPAVGTSRHHDDGFLRKKKKISVWMMVIPGMLSHKCSCSS